VEKSGQSLRSFYQYFAGKYELLLALFEDAVRANAAHLEAHIANEDDPLERLHLFVVEHYRVCLPTTKSRANAKKGLAPAMAEFAQQLLTEHPKEASHAFVPVVELLEGLLDDAAAAGAIRPGLNHRRVAGTILQTVMFNAFSSTISGLPVRGGDDAAVELWGVIQRGLAPDRR
jgi:AcrR family transcriptional regulator